MKDMTDIHVTSGDVLNQNCHSWSSTRSADHHGGSCQCPSWFYHNSEIILYWWDPCTASAGDDLMAGSYKLNC